MTYVVRFTFAIVDIVLLNIAILSGLYLGGETNLISANSVYLIVFSNLAWLFLVLISFSYQVSKQWSLSYIIKSQTSFLFIHLLVVAGLVFFLDKSYGLLQLAITYNLFIGAFFGYRLLYFYLKRVFQKESLHKNYAIIGKNVVGQQIRKHYLVNKQLGYRFAGFLDFDEARIDYKATQQFCIVHHVSELFFCLPNPNQEKMNELVAFSLNSLIQVKICFDNDKPQENITFQTKEKPPSIEINVLAIDQISNRLLKRGFDILFSSAVIILIFSWLFPILALLIKISSRGPIFFVQQRNGEGNKPFGCIKFRTMMVNREQETLQISKGDPRVTSVGSFLRKSSIDEFPQFFNVLIGEMSIVGPRPNMKKHDEEYENTILIYKNRHYVKPGITGLAQCMGYRGEIRTISDMEGRVKLDKYYIENWSFLFDIKIIYLTVLSLLRGSEKAY